MSAGPKKPEIVSRGTVHRNTTTGWFVEDGYRALYLFDPDGRHVATYSTRAEAFKVLANTRPRPPGRIW